MINPNLLVIKRPSDLTNVTSLEPGNFLFYDNTGDLKTIDTDLFYQLLNNFARPIAPTDAGPFTANRWYKPTTSSDDPGTNYPNAGNLKAKSGFDTLFYYDGTNWIKTEVALPGNIPLTVFDEDDNVNSSTMKAISNRFDGTREVLKYFLEYPSGSESLDKTFDISNTSAYNIYGINNAPDKILKQDNTDVGVSIPGYYFNIWKNIPTVQNGKRIVRVELDILTYGNPASAPNKSTNLVGITSEGAAVPLVVYSSEPAPTTKTTYNIDVSSYVAISLGLYVDDSNPISNTQLVRFYTKVLQPVENNVKDYIDNKSPNSGDYLDLIDFGCAGDGITDDTAKFNEAIVTVLNRGGGIIYGGDKKFKVSQITIPDALYWLKLEIAGVGIPAARFGTYGDFDLTKPTSSMEIISTISNESQGIIKVSNGTGYSGFNLVNLSLKNLTVRSYDNPNCIGVDASEAAQLTMENVVIDTGVYSVVAAEPTHNSVGLITPRINNAAFTYLKNVSISGYKTGMVVNEHTDGDQIILSGNYNALVFKAAHHASYFKRVCAQGNTNVIVIEGAHYFAISELDMEYTISGWRATVYELNDSSNLGRGNITYSNVKGDVGNTATFRINGGSNIIVKRLGSDVRLTGSGIPSV